MSYTKRADFGAWVSIFAYIFLSSIKIITSYFSNSEALLADGLNNLTDIGASLAVLIGIKLARKPRDLDHPYGHSRAEQIASLVASFIMFTIGLQVLIQGFQKIGNSQLESPDLSAAFVAFLSALFMYGIYRYNINLAKQTNNKALAAAAKDNLSDALVSIGTVIGVVASQFHLAILDPITAIIVALIICKTAWDIFYEATHMLTDGYDPEKMDDYKQTIAQVEQVACIKDIRARQVGNETLIEVTIEVDPSLDVIQQHQITDCIEELMAEKHGVANTHIHVEPHL
ncbi:MAG: cation diffusion facilitator family transporter [Bacillaceae bacterium]